MRDFAYPAAGTVSLHDPYRGVNRLAFTSRVKREKDTFRKIKFDGMREVEVKIDKSINGNNFFISAIRIYNGHKSS